MRKLLVVLLIVVLVVFAALPSYAWHLPDIKSPTIIYTIRHSELRLGVSFEVKQWGNYSLEVPVANNYVGISLNKQWVPLVEIVVVSGFTIGFDIHRGEIDGGLIVFSMIVW